MTDCQNSVTVGLGIFEHKLLTFGLLAQYTLYIFISPQVVDNKQYEKEKKKNKNKNLTNH